MGQEMELTWELAGQYLFLAALFASVLGLGKVLVILSALEWHFKEKTSKSTEYIKGRKKAVSTTIFVGLVEMTVGVFVMGLIYFFGDFLFGGLDSQGKEVVGVIGLVFFVLVVILMFSMKRFEKGLDPAK